MARGSFLLLSIAVVAASQLGMRRTALLEAGLYTEPDGRVLCYDCDHNGLQELVFRAGELRPRRWEIWEYRPVNRYELVFADTGVYPYPPGIATGNLAPFDVGDIDQDGRTDIVGVNRERANDTLYNVLVVMEGPDEHAFPDSLVWSFRYGRNLGGNALCRVSPDLDQDGRREVMCVTQTSLYGTGLWECTGDNQYELVWNRNNVGVVAPQFGDFDLDSLREFAGGWARTYVYENVLPSQDTYVLVYSDTTGLVNGADAFSARDLDRDGWPEFFICFYTYLSSMFHLYMWEATGNNTFERTLVDERRMVVGYGSGRSKCGDLDGDGVDELVWALPLGLFVYKAAGNNRFEQVWEWWDDHGGTGHCLVTNIADLNGNGYNELVVGGSGKTSVFEVEAVRVLYPDTSEEFCPGDTCLIRWGILTPPRCDSVSLFFLLDTIVPEGEWFWSMDTIVTGLSPGDTIYPWVVPDTTLDAAWIVAIAYGPGWQYSASLSPFRIVPSGVAERSKRVAPGPAAEPTIVGGMLWLPVGADAVLLDVTGRKVMDLPGAFASGASGAGRHHDIRHVAPGVYFVRSADSGGRSAVRKTVIQR
jgi:hypothetical protein